ncbi:DUF4251 domain-containing protein [Roseivirga pacifica]|jgi:hypothetical protein|uniref:DUF4251 domain-containing protein n=1 Tax=Roseivirga pacifica TaxID=1267423 RepID=UPI003BAB4EB2
MRRAIVLMMLGAFTFVGLNAQVETEEKSKREIRKEKREERRAASIAHQEEAFEAIQDKDFVLRTDMITTKWGRTIPVVNSVNFVRIDGDDIAVQFGDPINIGLNGAGGVTYQGKIQQYEIFERGKNKGVGVRINFNSPASINLITLYIEISGEYVKGQFNDGPNRLSMRGNFERASESTIMVNSNRRIGLVN